MLERSRSVAAAYAGRLLAAMGAEVVMLEPPGGSPLRVAPPPLGSTGSGESALFTYLAAGKRSLCIDLADAGGHALLCAELERADILIDDTPRTERKAAGLAPEQVRAANPSIVHVSVLPFGASGPKADWVAEEVNLQHAGGEGYLLPNGLSHEMFPDRAPLKIYGHFAGYQGGSLAMFAALSAWWAVPGKGGQFVDVAVQDAVLAVGAFALQRLGDGSLEHRATRRFRYGGVFETSDGYVELLTLEDRQWQSLVELLGRPAWALEASLTDPLERSRRGDEINRHLREWMRRHGAEEIVQRAQQLGVPVAKYRSPAEVLRGEHEAARELFSPVITAGGQTAAVLTAPFQFRCSPLRLARGVPALGELAAAPVALQAARA